MIDQSKHCIVTYHHIDDFRCFKPLKEALEVDENDKEVSDLKNNLDQIFKKAGWEGDGEINCFFLPPCFLPGYDTYCTIIYHVKQSNNGTSFLLIPNHVKDNLAFPKDVFSL